MSWIAIHRDMEERSVEDSCYAFGPFDTKDEARAAVEAHFNELWDDEANEPYFQSFSWASDTLWWNGHHENGDGMLIWQVQELTPTGFQEVK